MPISSHVLLVQKGSKNFVKTNTHFYLKYPKYSNDSISVQNWDVTKLVQDGSLNTRTDEVLWELIPAVHNSIDVVGGHVCVGQYTG